MATGIHSASKSKLRKDKSQNIQVEAALLLRDYQILILFSNNRMKVVDFAPAIAKYAKGYYSKYADKKNFSKFHIDKGNIVWGKEWDLIFPAEDIFNARF
jgi:hypothetical protein